MNVNIKVEFETPRERGPEDFEAFLDLVMDELTKINRQDVELSATLARYEATFTLYSEGDDRPSLDDFSSDVRTALHAAGCITAGWENVSATLNADLVTAA